MNQIRTAPYDENAEVSVLGACMLEQNAVDEALKMLDNTDFYKTSHREIFRAIMELSQKGIPVDQISVIDNLKKRNMLEKAGGAYYVTGLVESTPSAANVGQYARIVLEKSLLRKLITTAGETIEKAYSGKLEARDLIGESEQRLIELMQGMEGGRFKDFISLKDALVRTMDDLDDVISGKREPGLKTGLIDIDDILGGIEPCLVLLGGRPSHGKTALALKIMRYVAEHVGPVGIVSLETSDIKLVRRLLAAEARVNSMHIKTGKIDEQNMRKLTDACNILSRLPVYIDDSYHTNVNQILTRAKILKRSKGIKLLVVDYLQLTDSGSRSENRNLEIGKISRMLKCFAEREKIPVLALSQLTRDCEGRMPALNDLRDSGTLEQDADIVMFTFRPERANKKVLDDGTPAKNVALISIAKNKDGDVGECKLLFQKEYVLFENYITDRKLPF